MANSAHHKKWFLAQLKPNCARIACANLERQGFATFLPFEIETRLRGRRYTSTKSPLFPGYVFIELTPEAAPWRKICSTIGISRLIAFNGRPAPVPEPIIEGLMQRCDRDGLLIELDQFNPGDRVRIANGPLSSFVAQVDRVEPNRRVWLLMEIMGAETQVAVPHSDLRLAS